MGDELVEEGEGEGDGFAGAGGGGGDEVVSGENGVKGGGLDGGGLLIA